MSQIDLMIANQTLDLSDINLKSQPSRQVSFDNLLTVHGSQVDSSLVGAKSITYNPANKQIVFLDSSDNVRQIGIGNSNSSLLQQFDHGSILLLRALLDQGGHHTLHLQILR